MNNITHFDIHNSKKYRRKPTEVLAQQINEPFTVSTLEGVMTGKAGDYIVYGLDKADTWIVDKDIFESRYIEVKPLFFNDLKLNTVFRFKNDEQKYVKTATNVFCGVGQRSVYFVGKDSRFGKIEVIIVD